MGREGKGWADGLGRSTWDDRVSAEKGLVLGRSTCDDRVSAEKGLVLARSTRDDKVPVERGVVLGRSTRDDKVPSVKSSDGMLMLLTDDGGTYRMECSNR
uniref:Bm10255 n=1 Tax=Brugia malayi TaxID=6279 RepID=A0A1I9G377_BRUMA|nr:Bm10255 [Brugia malayi]